MSSFNRLSFLATKGNLAVKSGGTDLVWTERGGLSDVVEGQVVVYNPDTQKTLSVSDLETASSVRIGVGIKDHKGRMTLRHVGGDTFNLAKDTITMTATTPSCGCGQVIDVFPTCLSCNETYSLNVRLDDYLVRSRFDYEDKPNYVFTEELVCNDCDECNPEADATELLSKFRDRINGKYQAELEDRPLPRRGKLEDQYQPFRASLLYANSFTYELSLSDLACEDCAYFSAIGGALIDGETVTFTGTTDPADATRTLIEQKEILQAELNDALEATGGSAFITESDLKCCPFKIEINTCDADFELHDEEGTEITPTSTSNPLEAITEAGAYGSCTDNSSTFTPSVGLRIYVENIDWAIHNSALKNSNTPPPNTWLRTIEVESLGDGWEGTVYIQEHKKAKPIEGQGLFWQYAEMRRNHKGGSGRNFRYSNRNVGLNGIPDEFSRVRNEIVNANEVYCVYNVSAEMSGIGKYQNATQIHNTNVTWFLVPEGDVTTQTSVELYFNKLNQLGYAQNFDTCLGIVDDTNDVTVDVEATFDVSTNDTVNTSECDAVTYEIVGTSDNASGATINNSGVVTYTVTTADDYSIEYQVLCDGVVIGSGTLTGTASA